MSHREAEATLDAHFPRHDGYWSGKAWLVSFSGFVGNRLGDGVWILAEPDGSDQYCVTTHGHDGSESDVFCAPSDQISDVVAKAYAAAGRTMRQA